MSALRSESHEYVAPEELLGQIRAGTAPTILDVRSRWEFERGRVLDAVHIPFWALLTRARRLSGARAGQAHGRVLRAWSSSRGRRGSAAPIGLQCVLYLRGHMSGWRRSHLPEHVAQG